MALKAKKGILPTALSSGKMKLSEIRWLLYGPPGIGKTTLAAAFPNAVLLAAEKGYKALRVTPADILFWDNDDDKEHSFVHITNELAKGNHEFETAIIDTADKLFDLCSQHVLSELGISHESEAEWGKGWAAVKNEFERTISKLFMTDMGVIFISHTKTDTITTMMSDITKQSPTLSNQARKILLPLVDTIGFMRYKTNKISKGVYEEQFLVSFKPSEEIEAKDRTGMLPSELQLETIPADVRKTPDMVYKVSKRNYDRIAQCYNQIEEVEKPKSTGLRKR